MKLKQMISKVVSEIVPLNKKQITFESLNDLDCNSGALYNYIIENGLNRKYKIIWLIKKDDTKLLPKIKNVKYISYYSKKKLCEKIELRRSKYLIWDNIPIAKYNCKQKSIYLTHGFPAMKNVHGIINIPNDCDYFLITSKQLEDHAKYQFGIFKETKFILSGLPRNDYITCKSNEMKKITNEIYNKIIIWMPTFRKSKNSNRNDSYKDLKYGIPLIETEQEIKVLNEILKKYNSLMIIKIHGGQDTNFSKITNYSNIKLITIEDEKELQLNLYKLLACTDGLITDYSSVSFDYLLTNKPIGYIIDDMKEYKLGFGFENPLEYMPGDHIMNFKDLTKYVTNVSKNIDEYEEKRKEVLNKINDYQGNNNCERIFNLIDGGNL